MGVDFYTCNWCEDTFCDAGHYFSCDCGYHYCDEKCGDRKYDEEDEDKSTCRRCRREYIDDGELLHFLLAKYGLTKDEVVAMVKDKESQSEN